MPKAITNTFPLLYLYRANRIEWLDELFDEVWTPNAVIEELEEGKKRGDDVPLAQNYSWLKIRTPRSTPSEWLTLDLGKGELETMSLALENKNRIVILDDALARKIAQAAKIEVWGTLKVLLETKSQGLIKNIKPDINRLQKSGMWLSDDIRQRVLRLAGEENP